MMDGGKGGAASFDWRTLLKSVALWLAISLGGGVAGGGLTAYCIYPCGCDCAGDTGECCPDSDDKGHKHK